MGSEFRAVLVAELFGMKFYRQAQPVRRLEKLPYLFFRKGDFLAKGIDGINQTFAI